MLYARLKIFGTYQYMCHKMLAKLTFSSKTNAMIAKSLGKSCNLSQPLIIVAARKPPIPVDWASISAVK